MKRSHLSFRFRWLLAVAALLAGAGIEPALGQDNPGDPNYVHQFFLFADDVVVRFVYITNDATSIIARENGKCVQQVNVATAFITVFDAATFDVLATGEGNLNIQATVNCATRLYDGERIIVTSSGKLMEEATGEPLKFHLRAVLIKGILRVFEVDLDP
jgi:hypothetical protein